GVTNSLGEVTIRGTTIEIGSDLSTAGGPVELSANDGVLIAPSGTIGSGGGMLSIDADDDDDGVGIYEQRAAIATSDGDVSVIAADVHLNQTIDAGQGTITFEHSQPNRLIQLGGNAGFPADVLVTDVRSYRFAATDGSHSDFSGLEVALVGDINGDGIDDLLISAPHHDAMISTSAGGGVGYSVDRAGRLYIVFGGESNLLALDAFDGTVDNVIQLPSVTAARDASVTSGGLEIVGNVPDGRLGTSAIGTGDFNDDGHVDLLIGAEGEPFNSSAPPGKAYVIFGGPVADIHLNDPPANVLEIRGDASGDRFGSAVAVGDINGDGIDDVVIMASRGQYSSSSGFSSPARSNRAYVVFGVDASTPAAIGAMDAADGASDGFLEAGSLTSATGYRIETQRLVQAVAVGDISGDGTDDLILVGDDQIFNSSNLLQVGVAHVFLGERLGLIDAADGDLDGRIEMERADLRIQTPVGESTIQSVAVVGDINGDGENDLALGVPFDANGAGSKAYVVFGGLGNLQSLDKIGGGDGIIHLTNIDGDNGFRMTDIDAFGAEGGNLDLVSVGDINGDGFDDLAIGAATGGDGYPSPGQVHVVFGKDTDTNDDGTQDDPFAADLSVTTLDGLDGFTLTGAMTHERFGFSVSGSADIDGDGITDLLAGSPYNPYHGYHPEQPGSAYVVFGQSGSTGYESGEFHLSDVELTWLVADEVIIDAPGASSITRVLDDIALPTADGLTFDGGGIVQVCGDIAVGEAGVGGGGGSGGSVETDMIIFNQDVLLCADVRLIDFGSGVQFNRGLAFDVYDPDPGTAIVEPIKTLTVDLTAAAAGSSTLRIGDSADDTLRLSLAGVDASVLHERIVLLGRLELGGSLELIDDGEFSLSAGSEVVLIDNDASDAISGTFSSVNGGSADEGAIITISGIDYRLSYLGGDGNDVVVLLANTAPLADIGGPYIVSEGESITLDARGSSDAEDDPSALTYHWDLDNDGIFETFGATVSFAAIDGPDTKTVSLQVIDTAGASDIATTDILIENVSPTVDADVAIVSVDEGERAVNSGTFDDAGDDIVTITASIGTISQHDGSWTWTLDTTDGPDDSQTIIITATDSDGDFSTTSFELDVTNVSPTVDADVAIVSVDEGERAVNSGTFDDAGDDVVTITASIGTISQHDGSWTWTLTRPMVQMIRKRSSSRRPTAMATSAQQRLNLT
ncbi:MAG: PKD domain-containing protein, partial [Pirellulaceae bacterium]